MYAMNCKTDNFEDLDINNFTVVRVRIWERYRGGEQSIGFSFSIITARLTSSQVRAEGAECRWRKFQGSSQTSPQLKVEHFADMMQQAIFSYTVQLDYGSTKFESLQSLLRCIILSLINQTPILEVWLDIKTTINFQNKQHFGFDQD
jgi:hypothetical protein